MVRALVLLACASLLAPATAQERPAVRDLTGPLEASGSLVDPEFGIEVRALGLERRVEMFQWTSDGSGGVEGRWSADALDDANLPGGHANPEFPFRSRRWLAERLLVDGQPVDPALWRGRGEWNPLAADPARLPPNLAVVFQPIEGGLSSSEDADEPEVGDLRVSWRRLDFTSPAQRVVLQEGRWVAADGSVALATEPLDFPGVERDGSRYPWWIFLLLVAGVLPLVIVVFRRRR